MEEKFAVFLDIDGTLVGSNKVHPETLQVIREVRKRGHYVFLNTGRALSWVTIPKVVDLNDYDGIVSGIGTYILMNNEVIFENLIDKIILQEIIDYFLNTDYCFFVSCVDTGFIANPTPFFAPFPFVKLQKGENFAEKYKDAKVQKVEVFGKNIKDSDKQFLSKYLDVYDHGFYIECAPKGVTKSAGMERVLNRLGIPKNRTIAMGDSVNDIDMLKYAGISVAMGNAKDEVKDICSMVSTSCDDGGVGYALKKLILDK